MYNLEKLTGGEREFLEERLLALQKAVEVSQKLANDAASEKKAERRHFLMGLALYQLQEYDAALTHLEASFQFDKQAETAARLAVCNWRIGALPAAEDWIKQALAFDSKGRIETQIAGTRPSYLAILASIQLSRGEIEEAAKSAKAAVAMDGSDVSALQTLGTTQLVLGEAAAAEETFGRAIASAPKFIADKLTRERKVAKQLARANLSFTPFTTELAAIQRLIV